MPSRVNTVAGPVEVADLGVTYMHEHVFVLGTDLQWHWPGYGGWDEDRSVEEARVELRRLKEVHGCDTIVDPTVPGIGRNAGAVARAAEGTGLNVIMATGWYTLDALPAFLFIKSPEQKIATLLELFTADVEHGMDGTSIKPGLIKCATDLAGVTPDIEAVLRACARLHLQTGLPLTTHTDAATRRGLDQIAIFKEEGVDLSRVIIGHSNQTGDLDYLQALLDEGCWLGYDRMGSGTPTAPRELQLQTLVELIRRGHAGRIVLSHDNMVMMNWMGREGLEAYYPDFPYGHLNAAVLPGLRAAGVTDAQIEQMLVVNPREYFSS
jgi:phosphotriesterase-related protein